MISVMIVDDEFIVRQGIKTSIDWEAHGIKIIGEAMNGQSALPKIRTLRPDILITDIRMPVMDGLTLAEKVREEMPEMKIIILSGYGEFAYAKKSIHLNVAEYLLKPVGAEELMKAVLTQRDIITGERWKNAELQKNKLLVEENIDFIRARFIQGLLKNKYTDESVIKSKARNLRINLDGPQHQIILIDIDDFFLLSEEMSATQKDNLTQAVLKIASEQINTYTNCTLCQSESDYFIGVVNLKEGMEIPLESICLEIQKMIQEELSLSVTVSTGLPYANLASLACSYHEALLALRKKVYKGKATIICYKDLEEADKSSPVFFPTQKEKELLAELRFLNKEKVRELTNDLFTKFLEEMVDYSLIKMTTLRLILMSMGILEELGINIEEELQVKFIPDQEIEKYETIKDIKDWFIHTLHMFINLIAEKKSKRYKDIVSKSFQYVKDNYNQDISLEDVAKAVFVTPPYFSKVFKAETGENFTSWLNRYRIEQAIALLKKDPSLKCYELSSYVGYNDYKYFSSIFKKITGLTFSEYREKQNGPRFEP